MRPKTAVADDPCQRRSRDMLDDGFLLYEVEPCLTNEALQVPVVVQMFDGAAHVINFAHKIVMARTNEQFGPALELLPCLPDTGQNQAVDATGILMQPVEDVSDRAGVPVNTKGPEQSPMPAG